jgi:cytidine deaminase
MFACSSSAFVTIMNPDLVARAVTARDNALAGYSGFKVGAALETADGQVYTGCNVENASYGLTVCAERVALWKALSEGTRQFRQIVIVADSPIITPPCGACRQLLWEYCGDIPVYVHSLQGAEAHYQLADLLPHPFDSRSMGR